MTSSDRSADLRVSGCRVGPAVVARERRPRRPCSPGLSVSCRHLAGTTLAQIRNYAAPHFVAHVARYSRRRLHPLGIIGPHHHDRRLIPDRYDFGFGQRRTLPRFAGREHGGQWGREVTSRPASDWIDPAVSTEHVELEASSDSWRAVVDALEPACREAVPKSSVGIAACQSTSRYGSRTGSGGSAHGAVRMIKPRQFSFEPRSNARAGTPAGRGPTKA
jgi:hypothetical protein